MPSDDHLDRDHAGIQAYAAIAIGLRGRWWRHNETHAGGRSHGVSSECNRSCGIGGSRSSLLSRSSVGSLTASRTHAALRAPSGPGTATCAPPSRPHSRQHVGNGASAVRAEHDQVDVVRLGVLMISMKGLPATSDVTALKRRRSSTLSMEPSRSALPSRSPRAVAASTPHRLLRSRHGPAGLP